MSDIATDPILISYQVSKCLVDFRNVHGSLASAEPTVRVKLPASVANDLLGRFRLWVGNIGAHHKGRASLDYKLREASHIRTRVIELLQHLEHDLQDMLQIITGQQMSWEDMTDSDSDSDTSNIGSQFSEEHPPTELAQLISNMSEVIVCLMRLSIAIRNPAPHDRFRHSRQMNDPPQEPWDIAHVREKFPDAPEYLVLRLGRAISRRRQYLVYREEHRMKLGEDLDLEPKPQGSKAPQNAGNLDTTTSEWANSTVASSLAPAVKESIIVPDFGITPPDEDAASQTSYASSNSDPSKIRPPKLPEHGLNGEPFECPLCFRFTSVKHLHAWHKHVYTDLQPYVCTASGCRVPDHTYESRHEWFQHELQAHRKYWECIIGCNTVFQCSNELYEHIESKHAELARKARIKDIVRSCERQYSMDQEACCPLCTEKQRSLTQLRRHLGKHHEQLSLFAIPPHMNDNEEGDESDEADVSSISGGAASNLGSSNDEIIGSEDPFNAANNPDISDDEYMNFEAVVKEKNENNGLVGVDGVDQLPASTLTDVRTSRPTAQPLQSQSNTEGYAKPAIPAGVPESYMLSMLASRYVRKEKLVALLEKLFGGDAVVQYNVRMLTIKAKICAESLQVEHHAWQYWSPRLLDEEEIDPSKEVA
ncbi:hypothetical protein HBH56_105500 [Parastagonospora nodorum]|nr:hypothetical protein HBH56_105500 [Parastagonospora nodorum]KAH3929250.1 hypothetical protein HBH54_124910 [Parastagonospora nodorum]KAH3951582.1 hypothetical protein HBH53_058910 [Parastagonospora nodorum]KAH4032328.1 hypothetical protein HBI09_117430 [Parastagonospora nodorum]KAH4067612.1 hypothetical protein HBH50_129450 [Parastagonospora nodorum]